MSVYPSLARLYIRSFYNISGVKPRGTGAGLKRDLKPVVKAAGFVVLMTLVAGNLGYLFVMLNLGMYKGLATLGMQGLLILNAVVMATMLTFIVGFMTALSTYYLNDMELQLLAMPIQPRALFGAKFTAVYVSEAAFSVFFMAITMVVFGIKESPHPLFYIWGTITALMLPLPVLAASYALQIPLLSTARFLRNKKLIMIVGGVIGISCGLLFNVYFQGMMMRFQDPAALAESIASPASMVTRIGNAYPPALLAWKAMSDPASAAAFGSVLLLIAVCAAGPAMVVVFMSGAYARSLVDFNESYIRKLTRDGARRFIARRIRSGSVFLAMVKREITLMNREPMYLLNGPFIIILMPVIVGVMLLVNGDAMFSDPDMAGVKALIGGGFGSVLAALVGTFMGSSTSIACTAVSRDAKALPFIKSLPVKAATYMLAKFAHAEIFGVFGSVVGVGLIARVLGLDAAGCAAGLLVSLSLSTLLNLGGLWLDTANPRLDWDNPIAAMKQNPNAVIAILGTMGVAAGAGYLAFTTGMRPGAFALWFGVLPAFVTGVLLALYPRYAEKRLSAMEG
jgi:ABC-2 type transport system permease protein